MFKIGMISQKEGDGASTDEVGRKMPRSHVSQERLARSQQVRFILELTGTVSEGCNHT